MSCFRRNYNPYIPHDLEEANAIEQARKQTRETNKLRKNFLYSFSNLKGDNVHAKKRIRNDFEPTKSPRSRKVPTMDTFGNNTSRSTPSNDCQNKDTFSSKRPKIAIPSDELYYSDDGIPDFDGEDNSAQITYQRQILTVKEPEQSSQEKAMADLARQLEIEREKNQSLEAELAKTKKDISDQEKTIREKLDINKKLQGKSELSILRENVELKRKTDAAQKANNELEPMVKDLKKIRKLLIAKIQLCDNESDETDDDNLRTLDTLNLLKKYEKFAFRQNSDNFASSTEKDEKIGKLESKVKKLKAKNEKLKNRSNSSDNSLTLEKLEELKNALKVQANDPGKVKELSESLTECKSKLNLQRQINRTLEKQLNEMMDILHMPFEGRSFAKCLKALKSLQETVLNSGIRESNEVTLYENADQIIQTIENE